MRQDFLKRQYGQHDLLQRKRFIWRELADDDIRQSDDDHALRRERDAGRAVGDDAIWQPDDNHALWREWCADGQDDTKQRWWKVIGKTAKDDEVQLYGNRHAWLSMLIPTFREKWESVALNRIRKGSI